MPNGSKLASGCLTERSSIFHRPRKLHKINVTVPLAPDK